MHHSQNVVLEWWHFSLIFIKHQTLVHPHEKCQVLCNVYQSYVPQNELNLWQQKITLVDMKCDTEQTKCVLGCWPRTCKLMGGYFKSWVFCRVQWALNSGAKWLTVMNKSPTMQAMKNYNYITTAQLSSQYVYVSSLKYRNEYIHSLLKSCVRLISTFNVASKTSRITVPAETLSAGFVTGYNGISASQWR